jgi:hypothetical protein
MSFFQHLMNQFSSAHKMEQVYSRAIERAKKHDIPGAVADYSTVVDARSTPLQLRAMALMNRAKAYSALKSNEKARADLIAVLALPKAPAAVKDAAREKLTRMMRYMKQHHKSDAATAPPAAS